ncbi:MAG: YbaB/EbfC family nucleoid-associated protein [Acidimicrobiales bacterium]
MSTDDDTPITPDAVVQSSGLAEDSDHAIHRGTENEAEDNDPLAALLGGGAGGAGGLDLGALMEQASNMQHQLLAAQEQAGETVCAGVAGGGAVRIELTGALEVRSVTISPDAVDPSDVEMLQDLVLAALRDAIDQVQQLQAGSIDLGGLDLGGLLGGT